MRVVARVHGFPPATNAGAEWALAPMLAALVQRDHAVETHLTHPLPPPYRRPWVLEGVRVFPEGTWSPLPPPGVYVTHLGNVRPVSDAARGSGVPLVVIMTNTNAVTQSDIGYASPSLLVLNSEWMATHLGRPQRSIVVRPPVRPRDYETAPGDMVTQISLTEGKGGHLFWALARAMPGTRFLAVQGSYGDQIIPQAVPPNVTLLPAMDGRRMRDEVYARTRILLVPSDYESWGRVATEAMCSGIPVIANRCPGGLAENLGNAAVWADRDDPGTWVTQITRLSKRAAWEKASEASRKRSAELDPAADLERWAQAVEGLVT